jgi:hypothetical protein
VNCLATSFSGLRRSHLSSRHYRQWTDPSGPPDLDAAIARYPFVEEAGREVRDEVPSRRYLEIPAAFSVQHKDVLQSPVKEFKANWKYAKDVLMNIAVFVPPRLDSLRISCADKKPRRAILTSIIACGMLSFVIGAIAVLHSWTIFWNDGYRHEYSGCCSRCHVCGNPCGLARLEANELDPRLTPKV